MKLSLSGTVFIHPLSGQRQFWDKLKIFYCASSFSLKELEIAFPSVTPKAEQPQAEHLMDF